ncbi:unnamed protein product [Rhodiola kirilowii]
MDFIEGLPPSLNKHCILVVIDRLSKNVHFLALSHPYTTIDVAQVYMDNIFKLHGMPQSIISDRDPIFLSQVWKESKWLPLAEWWYNTTFHIAIRSTPYEIVYGQPPPIHLPYLPGESSCVIVDRSLQKREEIISMLKFHLLRAQNRMKQYADSHRSAREFKVGDYVYLKLQLYRQHSLKTRVPHKLSSRFYGPFHIVDRIGPVAYKLELPPKAAIHDVFHVSQLKLCTTPPTKPPELPQYLLDLRKTKEPKAILDRKIVKRCNAAATKILVKWKGSYRASNLGILP